MKIKLPPNSLILSILILWLLINVNVVHCKKPTTSTTILITTSTSTVLPTTSTTTVLPTTSTSTVLPTTSTTTVLSTTSTTTSIGAITTTTAEETEKIDIYLGNEGNCANAEVVIRAETINGHPIGNVNMRIFLNENRVGYGQTDSEGVFTFTPEDAGQYEVMAGKTGFNTANISINVIDCTITSSTTTTAEETEKLSIYLGNEGNCANAEAVIRAEDIGGHPIDNVNIRIFFNERRVAYGQTDSEGVFTFTPEDAGQYEVMAGKTGFNTANTLIDIIDCSVDSTDIKAVLLVRARTDRNEIHPGDSSFYVMVDFEAKKGNLSGVGATITIPEGFDVDNTAIIGEGLIKEGEKRTLNWSVKSSNSTPEGEYSFMVDGFGVDHNGKIKTYARNIYVKIRVEPPLESGTDDGIVRMILKAIYGFGEGVYEIVSNTPTWIILLLMLLALVHTYHVGSCRRYAKEQEIEGEVKERVKAKREANAGRGGGRGEEGDKSEMSDHPPL